jgi:UDP-N-acetylmuramoyl-tripeptide--D-alanyl-D-alanine ligase
MDPRPLSFIAAATGGELRAGSPNAQVEGVSTDSRQVARGDLFVALPGTKFDGHEFVAAAFREGAAAALVARGRLSGPLAGGALIAVDDTRRALGRLAARYREDFTLPVIAVAGSNGKTTTKELLAAVLRQRFSTVSSEASFNNDIGVPLTLLRLKSTHDVAVLEAGTNHPGELAHLLGLIRPRYGALTCIGREHLEFFGDLEGVAQEEGCLADSLPANGLLFANGDDPWTAVVARRARAAVVRVGLSEANDWRAHDLRLDQQGVSFRVQCPRAALVGEFRVHLLGRHQVVNALLALAIGAELGLDRGELERGLAECRPAKRRLEVWELKGVSVLDDAYNANADSMVAALQTLRDLPCKGRRVAVLGDMAELGAHSVAAHEEVGRRAAELGVGQLFAVGKMAPCLARGARGAGLNRVLEFADVDGAAAALKLFLKEGDLLLLKASRASRLERIADQLRASEGVKTN